MNKMCFGFLPPHHLTPIQFRSFCENREIEREGEIETEREREREREGEIETEREREREGEIETERKREGVKLVQRQNMCEDVDTLY